MRFFTKKYFDSIKNTGYYTCKPKKTCKPILVPLAKCNYPITRKRVDDCSTISGDCNKWYQTKKGINNVCVVDSIPRTNPPPAGSFWCKADSTPCSLT